MSEESKAEVVAPEEKVPEPNAEPEAAEAEAKVPASKRTKAQAEATAKVRACKNMAELTAVWADLKPAQRDWAAYYETGRRIVAAAVP